MLEITQKVITYLISVLKRQGYVIVESTKSSQISCQERVWQEKVEICTRCDIRNMAKADDTFSFLNMIYHLAKFISSITYTTSGMFFRATGILSCSEFLSHVRCKILSDSYITVFQQIPHPQNNFIFYFICYQCWVFSTVTLHWLQWHPGTFNKYRTMVRFYHK